MRPNELADMLRAQEDIRRDIARQMHDGPVQSLANIALQSEIVERLVGRGDSRATSELAALRRMVQSTLAQTKDFVFDVRPMVLDDLGLVPTLRRTAIDRGQRSGIEIEFDSSGTDRRLAADLEIGLFRILDDAIAGYVALRPIRVTARIDWGDRELSAIVRAVWAAPEGDGAATAPLNERRSELPPAARGDDRTERERGAPDACGRSHHCPMSDSRRSGIARGLSGPPSPSSTAVRASRSSSRSAESAPDSRGTSTGPPVHFRTRPTRPSLRLSIILDSSLSEARIFRCSRFSVATAMNEDRALPSTPWSSG